MNTNVMNTIHINRVGGDNSNLGLRGKAHELKSTVLAGYRPDGDGWEPIWVENSILERHKLYMKLRGSRKQKAARMYVPRASVTIVSNNQLPDPNVVKAQLMTKTPEDLKIEELERQIKALLGQ